MEKLMSELFEACKGNEAAMQHLVLAANKSRNFTVAGKLCEATKDMFPVSPEKAKAIEKAKEYDLLFRMIGVKADLSNCWLLAEAMELYKKKKGKFDILDATMLQADKLNFFE